MVFEAPNYNRTRTTMVRGLRDLEDQKVWNRFFESYWKLIYHSARKAGLDDADAQEVVQETVITVTKKIGDFDYDRSKGSFKGWLMQTTKWKVLDQFRKINRNANRENLDASENIEQIPDELPDLDSFWKQNWQKELFDAALEKTKGEVNPLYFQIYNRLVIKEKKAKEVARELDVPVSQVYLAKHRVTEAIKKSIEQMNHGYQ